ncbi:MAG: glycosyltransferase family 4 protein [Deltaproteobacteria bacterium]|nr:glycosyltransferase family 4 protein [Deltaproteobacteria bacterium]
MASRVGGIPDLVKDGQNGLLVPPEDASALAKAISDLLSDKERRNRMGEAGKKMCLPYSAEAMVEQIDDLYKDLLEKYSNNRDTRVRFLLDKKTEELK